MALEKIRAFESRVLATTTTGHCCGAGAALPRRGADAETPQGRTYYLMHGGWRKGRTCLGGATAWTGGTDTSGSVR